MNLPAAPQATGPLVLVVEDEPGIATILSAYLQRDGLRARQAHDGLEALRLFRQLKPDMVLLDIHLPGMDGLDLLRAIREDGQTPVIMVTALADDVDKLVGLRLGADDYVVKPFSPPEVVARVRAVLRRAQAQPAAPARAAQRIRVGRIEIDQEAHAAFAHGDDGRAVPLPLTLTEYRLLACLAAQPRRCFSRSHLIEHCLPESDALDRVIDSHLSKAAPQAAAGGAGRAHRDRARHRLPALARGGYRCLSTAHRPCRGRCSAGSGCASACASPPPCWRRWPCSPRA